MARGKRRGGRRGALSKMGRKIGSAVGSGIQIFGALHGVISGVTRAGISKDTPAAIVYDYSGYDTNTGGFSQAQAAKSATVIIATFIIGWGIKQLARRM